MKYLKIDTLYMRDVKAKGKKKPIIFGEYADPIFPNIINWLACEKIDGTNVRIILEHKGLQGDSVYFDGRTDNAQLPARLFNYLKDLFTIESLDVVFKKVEKVVLFGEGYGYNINDNRYAFPDDTVSFILFDVWIDGYWLERKNVVDIAENLGIESVPELGVMTKEEIIEKVKGGFLSDVLSHGGFQAEGIVATAHPMVLNRDGNPVKFKLKERDFK